MVDRTRLDSSRDLLDQVDSGWGAAPEDASEPTAGQAHEADDLPEPAALSPSTPDLAALDDGWLDDVFPGDDADDDDDELELERERADGRLDPEAFARAQREREERARRKKEKKRAKADAKRSRQKERAAAGRQKQRAKKPRSAVAPRTGDSSSIAVVVERSPREPRREAKAARSGQAAPRRPAKAAARPSKAAARPSTLASIKLLAIVLCTLLALAALVATIVK